MTPTEYGTRAAKQSNGGGTGVDVCTARAADVVHQRRHTSSPAASVLNWYGMTNASVQRRTSSYGDALTFYTFTRAPRLINLGSMRVRTRVVDDLVASGMPRRRAAALLDANEQYSGGAPNRAAHAAIERLYGDRADGTIIRGHSGAVHASLQGASEVVLWREVLEPVHT